MKRISLFVVGLALMVAGPAAGKSLSVPLPPVPTPAVPPLPPLPLPPVPTVPPVNSPLPKVEVPSVPSLPQVPSTGGGVSNGAGGTGSTGPQPAGAQTQREGSRGGGTSVRGSSGAGAGSTGARTSPSGAQAALAGRAGAPAQGRDQARVVRRERRLRSTVQRYQGCLDGLTELQRRVLVLRAGLGEERPHTRSGVARLLDLNTRRVGRVEGSGLRRLRALGRGGACVPASATSGSALAPAAASVQATPPRLWARLPGDLALPLGRIEVKGEQDSSSPEPELAEAPEAVVPPAGGIVARKGRDARVDVTLPLLLVLVAAGIAVAVRATVRALRAD